MLLQIILTFVSIEKITLYWSVCHMFHLLPFSFIFSIFTHLCLRAFLSYLHLSCMRCASFHLSHISDSHPVLQWWLASFEPWGGPWMVEAQKSGIHVVWFCTRFYLPPLPLPFLVTSFCVLMALSDGNENFYSSMENTLRLGRGAVRKILHKCQTIYFWFRR